MKRYQMMIRILDINDKSHSMKISVLMTAALLPGAVIAPKAIAAEQVKKNVVFIAVDDLKPLLGCYGDKVAITPNIDALAKTGVVFSNAYCQQAVSGPSRASLLTGMCPDRTQVWDLKTQIRSKNPDVVTLPQYFKQNGYETAGIGKIFDPRSVDKAYDTSSWSVPFIDANSYMDKNYPAPVLGHYQSEKVKEEVEKYKKQFESEGLKARKLNNEIMKLVKPSTESAEVPDDAYFDGGVANGAVEYIRNTKAGEPFMLAVGFKKPHLPFCAPKKYWDLYKRENMPLAAYRKKAEGSPDFAYHQSGELKSYTDIPSLISFSDIDNAILPDSKAKELIHGYYASISYTDAQIGKVMAELKKKGLDKNTIIVLWGDHGWHLGDHGLWNKHTNFEQATHVPMIIVDPSQKGKNVSTPVEFLDIYPTLCDMAGLVVPKHLDGESLVPEIKGKESGTGYAASQYPRVNKMGYSIRTGRYRYTVWVDWKNKITNADKVYAEELYDYQEDPNETKNLMNDPAYAEVVNTMKANWEDYKSKRLN